MTLLRVFEAQELSGTNVGSNPPDQRILERRQLAVIPDVDATTVRVIVDKDPTFPSVCAKCRGSAQKTLTVERVFATFEEGSDGNYWYRSVAAYHVPFCDECVSRHRLPGRWSALAFGVAREPLCGGPRADLGYRSD